MTGDLHDIYRLSRELQAQIRLLLDRSIALGLLPESKEGYVKMTWDEHERKIVKDTLEANNGNITKTVKQLKICRSTFYRKMECFGMHRRKKSN